MPQKNMVTFMPLRGPVGSIAVHSPQSLQGCIGRIQAVPRKFPDYTHFRYYSAGMGRFMRPDNINGNMTNPQSWNLYSYVGNNPVRRNDPTGHWYRQTGLGSGLAPRSLWQDYEPSMEEYLWGGATVSSTYQLIRMTDANGSVVGQLRSDDSVGPFQQSQLSIRQWLLRMGIPQEQVAAFTKMLKDEPTRVGSTGERVVALVFSKQFEVWNYRSKSVGSDAASWNAMVSFHDTLLKEGWSGIGALGHAHYITGNNNPISNHTTLEGPSVADWAGYRKVLPGLKMGPDWLFVVTSGAVYWGPDPTKYFQQMPF